MLTQLDAHVFDSPTAVCGAGRAQWAQCLDAFSVRNAGRVVTVEEDLRDLGIMPTAVNATLRGVSFDRRDGAVQIMLATRAAGMRHRTVVARDILAVDTLVTADGRDVALRLAVPKGQVLVTFLMPAKALAVLE
jgi:hypothetical protein